MKIFGSICICMSSVFAFQFAYAQDDSGMNVFHNVQSVYDFEIDDEDGTDLDLVSIIEFYTNRNRPMSFWIQNQLPATEPPVFIAELECTYTYIDVFGQNQSTGVSRLSNTVAEPRILPGQAAILQSNESKCVIGFDCRYLVKYGQESKWMKGGGLNLLEQGVKSTCISRASLTVDL